jgi:LacI family transcriptional regulator
MGAMKAIIDAGLNIPSDIALIGCGNLHFDNYLRIPLSSIDQQTATLGQHAARLAVELIENGTPPQPKVQLLEPKLVIRDSSRRI